MRLITEILKNRLSATDYTNFYREGFIKIRFCDFQSSEISMNKVFGCFDLHCAINEAFISTPVSS